MTLQGQTVLVTGAGGFIGSHLTELLVREGANVRAAVHYNSRGDTGNLALLPPDIRKAIELRPLDITDPFAVDHAVHGCRVVFHLAALIGIPYSYVAPASYVDVNVKGTLNVLQAGLRHNVERIVHTSTSEVYGTARYTPIDEEHPLQGQSPYSASKIAADKIAESYHRSFNVPVVTLRPFNTYGPRQSTRAVIPTIVTQALHGGVRIVLGSLEPVRDFTFVTDTARAFVAAGTTPGIEGEVLNAGFGSGITIGELVDRILAITGSRADVEQQDARVRPEHSEVLQLICSRERIERLTGWRPQVSLAEGLQRVVEHIQKAPRPETVDQYHI